MDLDQSNIPNQINQQHNINNNTNNNNNQNSSLSLPPIGDQAAAAIAAAQNNNNNNNNNNNPNPATFAAPFPSGTMQVPANITASIFQNGIPNNSIINNNNTNTISPNNQNSNNNNNNNSSGNSEEEEEDIDIQMNGINGTNSINGTNNGSSNPTSSFQNDTDMTQTSNNSSNTSNSSNSSNTETNEQGINDGANSNGSNSSNSSNSSDEGDGDPNDGDYDNTEDLNNNIDDDDDEDDDIDIKPKEKSRSKGSKSKSKSKTKSKSKSKSKSLGSSKSKNKENNNNDNNSNNSSNSNNNNIKEKDKSLYQDKIIFSSSDFDQIYNIEIDNTIASSLSYPMEQCYKLVTFIKEQRACGVFCEKVDEDYLKRYNIEQYKNTVRFPMDFVTITDYLENDEYENIFDFAEDCRLVFANAKKFNKPGSDIYEGAESLNQLFNKKFIQLRHHLKIYYDNKTNNNNKNKNNNSNGHNGMEVDNDDDIGRKQCSEKYKYDARYRLRYGGAGDDKFHKRIDWDNEENARKFRDCRDSKTIVQKREVYRDKESSHTNRKKFSILFNELGRIMTQETGNSSTKAEKCFIKIIEFIEQNSPNALHGTEETQENEDGNNVVVSKGNELDLEIYYIDADTLQYCINECEKCIGKNKSANIVAEGMNNASMSPRARKN